MILIFLSELKHATLQQKGILKGFIIIKIIINLNFVCEFSFHLLSLTETYSPIIQLFMKLSQIVAVFSFRI